MERHWSHYMHLGFVHFMLFPEVMGGDGPILESLRHLTADDFFQVAEITHIADPAVAKRSQGPERDYQAPPWFRRAAYPLAQSTESCQPG